MINSIGQLFKEIGKRQQLQRLISGKWVDISEINLMSMGQEGLFAIMSGSQLAVKKIKS